MASWFCRSDSCHDLLLFAPPDFFFLQTPRRLRMAAAATQAVSPSNGSLCLDAVAAKDGAPAAIQNTAMANTKQSGNFTGVAQRAPTVGDAQANEELASAWADMEDRMYQLAEMSRGTDYDPNLRKENVLDNFDTVRSEREKKSAKWGKLRKTVNNTLTVISNVGGMVADAASQVSTVNDLPLERKNILARRAE